jgi:hypothetical protein
MSRCVEIPDVPNELHAELTAEAEQAGSPLHDYLLRKLVQLGCRGHNAEFFRRARTIPGPRLSRESIVAEIRAMRGVDEL